MKVLYFTKYSRLGASSRLRSYQYFPFLEAKGIAVSVSPLFNDAYLEHLYSGKKSIMTVLLAYLKRFFVFFTVFRYDKVVIEKELFPYLPPLFERILAFLGIKYIVDYDDAIFHNYDLSTNKAIRFFLKHKIDTVMKCAGTVVAGNSYLASRALQSGAVNVVVLPTVIDISRYEVKQKQDHEEIVIGWIGSPSTYKYVKTILPVIEKLSTNYSIVFQVIGAKETYKGPAKVEFLDWSETSEVNLIQQFDIGIMPLENSPWEQGKCAYKLIQYMGCGIPVVASPVGMNSEVVHQENGFLADREEQWYQAFEKLVLDATSRKTLGANGRKKVEEAFSLQKASQKIIALLED
ncbi:glycosyltransferase family 4 protein [Flavobacterium pedocola]